MDVTHTLSPASVVFEEHDKEFKSDQAAAGCAGKTGLIHGFLTSQLQKCTHVTTGLPQKPGGDHMSAGESCSCGTTGLMLWVISVSYGK